MGEIIDVNSVNHITHFGRTGCSARSKYLALRGNVLLAPLNPKPSLTSTCDKKITVNETVIQAAPHMHLLGTSLKLIANPGTPREKIILNRPNYNFDDQSATVLKTQIQLKVGDTVRVICTFNPKLRQQLPQLKKLAAKYLTWGEGSSDEMCLGVMGVSVAAH